MRFRDCVGLVAAVSIGPLLQLLGNLYPALSFAGGALFLLVCAVVVPLIVMLSGRLRFVVWQIAIFSIIISTVTVDLRAQAMRASEIPSVTYVFWASGTVLSLPLPLFYMLRPLRLKQRFITGGAVLIVAGALWLGVRSITG